MISFETLLNEQQYEAATCDAKHLRIIAGAGTGKTRALTYRIAYLLTARGVRPENLVAITFTNKVATEMKERVRNIVIDTGTPVTRLPFIATYHGFCLRFLRSEISCLKPFTKDFSIADDDDQKKYLKDVAKKQGISDKSDTYKDLRSTLAAVKCRGILPDEVRESDIASRNIRLLDFYNFYVAYQALLKKNNSLDFDDILIFARGIIRSYPEIKERYHRRYTNFLVDEYQDTNDLQYKLLKEFLGPESELTVVGDPDQTIYTWRGADANLIRRTLSDDFKDLKTVVLNRNYRSTQTVLDTANLLINHNRDREVKNLVAASGLVGEEVDFRLLNNQELEARYIASKIAEEVALKQARYSDIAIIYRSNYLSRAIENALAQKRIPYRIYGGHRFYDRVVVKSALAYLKVLINPLDDASVERILTAPTRGIGDKAKGELISYSYQNGFSYLESLIEHADQISFSKRSKEALAELKEAFGYALSEFKKVDRDGHEAGKIVREYLDKAGFLDYVDEVDRRKREKEGDDVDLEIDNVNELISNLVSFIDTPPEAEEGEELDVPSLLSLFLCNVTLLSQQDEMVESDAVKLMTVHVSKGLEFDEVFVAGLVNGVFPTSHALNDFDSEPLEEERRMLYVAFTRAKKKLHATSFMGFNYVMRSEAMPSMFLSECGLLQRPRDQMISEAPRRRAGTSFDEAASVKAALKHLPRRDRAPEVSRTSASLAIKRGLESKNKVEYDYKVGDKVVSISYGIGTVTAVDYSKVTAVFPDKADERKEVKFLSSGLGFRPYEDK